MLKELRRNAASFAAFKSHSQIAATVDLLKDQKGNLREWADFKKEALKLDKDYNTRWLRTEYDHAVTTSRAARKWDDIQRTKKNYPNLIYKAINDDRTRQLHRKWDGIILPVDHPFWKNHYPPNDWGCRCTVGRTKAAPDTKGYDVNDMPRLPRQFNTNAGQTGRVFDKSHPYFANGSGSASTISQRIKAHKNKYPDYTFLKDKGVSASPWADAADFANNLRVGAGLSRSLKWEIKIRPHLDNFKTGIGATGQSNPELLINGFLGEIKTVGRNINAGWKKAKAQGAEIIVFELSEELSVEQARRQIKGELSDRARRGKGSPFKEIILLKSGKYEIY